MSRCQPERGNPYAVTGPHEFGDWHNYEERGLLVITHGPRASRVYVVEKTWREHECKDCGHSERIDEREFGSEWPGGVR